MSSSTLKMPGKAKKPASPITTKPLRQEVVDAAVSIDDVTSLGKGVSVTRENRMVLSPATAERFLELTPFESERALNSNWVAYLKKAMQRGTFRPELVTLAVATCDEIPNALIRLNGQHTSHAIKAAKKSYNVRQIQYRCKTLYDLRQLYASIDRNKARTSQHIASSYLDGSEVGKFGRYIAPLLLNGLSAYLYPEYEARKHDADERCFLLLSEYESLALKIGRFLQANQGVDARRYYRRASIGAMFAMFHKSSRDALEFWNQVVTGVGIKAKSPVLLLQSYLLRVRKTTIRQRDRFIASDEEILRACLVAWNAWREGKQITALKPGSLKARPAVV